MNRAQLERLSKYELIESYTATKRECSSLVQDLGATRMRAGIAEDALEALKVKSIKALEMKSKDFEGDKAVAVNRIKDLVGIVDKQGARIKELVGEEAQLKRKLIALHNDHERMRDRNVEMQGELRSLRASVEKPKATPSFALGDSVVLLARAEGGWKPLWEGLVTARSETSIRVRRENDHFLSLLPWLKTREDWWHIGNERQRFEKSSID